MKNGIVSALKESIDHHHKTLEFFRYKDCCNNPPIEGSNSCAGKQTKCQFVEAPPGSYIDLKDGFLVSNQNGLRYICIYHNHKMKYGHCNKSSIYFSSKCDCNVAINIEFDESNNFKKVSISGIFQKNCQKAINSNIFILQQKLKDIEIKLQIKSIVDDYPYITKENLKKLLGDPPTEEFEVLYKKYDKEKRRRKFPKNLEELFSNHNFNYLISPLSTSYCAIFCREWSLPHLKNSTTVISDGTFKLKLDSHFQTVVISGFDGSLKIASMLVMLSGKRRIDYDLMIYLIRQQSIVEGVGEIFDSNKTIVMDNESGSNAAFEYILPGRIVLCDFHTKQSFLRNLNVNGFPKLNAKTSTFQEVRIKHILNKIIVDCIQVQSTISEINHFQDYFSKEINNLTNPFAVDLPETPFNVVYTSNDVLNLNKEVLEYNPVIPLKRIQMHQSTFESSNTLNTKCLMNLLENPNYINIFINHM